MDFTANIRRRKTTIIVSDSLAELYPHDLSLYETAPSNTIPLSEFEDLALERLQLLRILEQASLKGHKLYSLAWQACVKEDLQKNNLRHFVRLIGGYNAHTDADHQARRADFISHFIHRIAFCRSEDLRRWFINRELEWFRLKFGAQTPDNVKSFIEINKLSYSPISGTEKDSLREELLNSTASLAVFDATDFYKVHFTEVCPLVKNRRVFLKRGMAYIPGNELVVCLMSKFRSLLSESLSFYNSRLPLLEDDRLLPLLSNLHEAYTGKNYVVREDTESVDPANLDIFSKKHFPLCMRQMHEVLRAEHHHKHQGRLTYGLFLKSIGLLYEDAVQFWKEEFTKKMDSSKFEKDYLYNIKHQYGKVGNMVNYSPYSCVKIINASVGPGEHHGCPFKLWDPNVIKQKSMESGISQENANEIKELVSNHHYQIACSKYFEYTHAKPPSNAINHPNQYFEESSNLEKEKSGK